MEDSLREFSEISKFAGERFDLVQAGGGNSSVKTPDGRIYIKSSGFLLSEIEGDRGFSVLNNHEIQMIMEDTSITSIDNKALRDKKAFEAIGTRALITGSKPSIETFLHSSLRKYTLHTHPIVVSMIAVRNHYEEIFKSLFPECVVIPYNTPGYSLGRDIKRRIGDDVPEILFLQNHGIIITTDTKERMYHLFEDVVLKLEGHLGISLERYRNTTGISRLLNSFLNLNNICYLTENHTIQHALRNQKSIFFEVPISPDMVVYCGKAPLVLHSLDPAAVKNYIGEMKDIPKVVMYDNLIYIYAPSIAKAKQIEEMLVFICLILSSTDGDIHHLSQDEIDYLTNWDAEKYRRYV